MMQSTPGRSPRRHRVALGTGSAARSDRSGWTAIAPCVSANRELLVLVVVHDPRHGRDVYERSSLLDTGPPLEMSTNVPRCSLFASSSRSWQRLGRSRWQPLDVRIGWLICLVDRKIPPYSMPTVALSARTVRRADGGSLRYARYMCGHPESLGPREFDNTCLDESFSASGVRRVSEHRLVLRMLVPGIK